MPRTRFTPWAYACWFFGIVLVLSILLAGGSVIWWMEQNHNMANTEIASVKDYHAMRASFKHWALLGLQIGFPAVILYLVSLVMHLRSKHAAADPVPREVAPQPSAPPRPAAPPPENPGDEWD